VATVAPPGLVPGAGKVIVRRKRPGMSPFVIVQVLFPFYCFNSERWGFIYAQIRMLASENVRLFRRFKRLGDRSWNHRSGNIRLCYCLLSLLFFEQSP
jgi:hypothetical protein